MVFGLEEQKDSEYQVKFLIWQGNVYFGRHGDRGACIRDRYQIYGLEDAEGFAIPARKEITPDFSPNSRRFSYSYRPYGKKQIELLKEALPGWKVHNSGCTAYGPYHLECGCKF